MNWMSSRRGGAVVVVSLLAVVAGFVVLAQQPPAIKRNLVLEQDLSLPGREGVVQVVEFPVGAKDDRHSHFAESFVFVLDGSLLVENEGRPTATLKAGDVFHVGPGTVHRSSNAGSVPARFVSVLIAEKNKPRSTPAE